MRPALCLSRPGSADLHWWAQRDTVYNRQRDSYHAEGCVTVTGALVLQTDVVMGLQIHRKPASTPRLGLTPTFGAVPAWPRCPEALFLAVTHAYLYHMHCDTVHAL